MNHPHDDELLLLVYGELAPAEAARLDEHLTQCDTCRAELAKLESAHAALALAIPRRPRRARWWVATGLAAAAVLAAVLLTRSSSPQIAAQGWQPTSQWSLTAGYVTGGRAMMEIDAQLTRLEQERSYGLPN